VKAGKVAPQQQHDIAPPRCNKPRTLLTLLFIVLLLHGLVSYLSAFNISLQPTLLTVKAHPSMNWD
jgi:hypothetical protein